MLMKEKVRLDKLLPELGLAQNEKHAQALSRLGKVLVNGRPITKPGTAVEKISEIKIRASEKYASRGGVKLEAALENFPISPAGKICLDVGASTGGFTDLLLQKGAQKVYALDVGKGLLDWKIRNDPRVKVMEKFNARHLSASTLPEKIQLATVDVSFISLELILTPLKTVLEENAEVLALVKPQFELPRKFVEKGVVKDEELQLQAVQKILNFAQKIGFQVLGQTKAKIKGPKGNQEFFIILQLPKSTSPKITPC